MEKTGNPVIMWTAQTQEVLDVLARDGVSYVKREYIRKKYGETAWIFETAYQYFIGKFRERLAKPDVAESPVWLFKDAKWAGVSQGTSLIRLEVPREEIIFFDRTKWSQVLNLSYVGTDREREEFEREMRRQGVSDSSDVFTKPFYPMLKNQIIKSWDSLFDVDGLPDEGIQGAVWRLEREWIREII